jgi:hypothetical protein
VATVTKSFAIGAFSPHQRSVDFTSSALGFLPQRHLEIMEIIVSYLGLKQRRNTL